MLKECYFSADNQELFLDRFMSVSSVIEPLFPKLLDFLSWAQLNVPDGLKAAEPGQGETP
jgi:hypothetical protein